MDIKFSASIWFLEDDSILYCKEEGESNLYLLELNSPTSNIKGNETFPCSEGIILAPTLIKLIDSSILRSCDSETKSTLFKITISP